jgi:DNA-binding GntR family transcriptional regulator
MAMSVSVIRDHVREAILAGTLQPGEMATQSGLAESLGVSRTPMREALRMLELEGLVVRESNGRVRVTPLSVAKVEELTVMRMTLETIAVRLTVPTLGNPGHAELEGLLAQMERLAVVGDWAGLQTPDRTFHRELVAGGGERIVDLLGNLWQHAERYRRMSVPGSSSIADEWAVRGREHRTIVDAFEAYDADEAVRWTAVQIARTAIGVAQQIDPDSRLPHVRTTLAKHAGSGDLP